MSRPQHDLHDRGGGGENGGGGGGGLSSLVAFASFAARNETEAMQQPFPSAQDAASSHQPPPAPFMQAPGSYNTSSITSSNPRLATLLHALSTPLRRRFVLAEFFTATVDRDYFHQNEFQESLDLLGLSHVQKLTRTEWSQIRACLGRRRRLSPAFLHQERQRLEEYRQVVRHIQQGVLAGPPPEFDFEVPTPLVVGQSVTAYHKGAKLIAWGQILTADNEGGKYRVQFERPELNSEICHDTDIAVHGAPLLLFARPSRQEVDLGSLMASDAFNAAPGATSAGTVPAAGMSTSDSRQSLMEEGELETEGLKQAQAQLVIFSLKMQDRKEALLTALRELNEQAEVAAKGGASPAMPPLGPTTGASNGGGGWEDRDRCQRKGNFSALFEYSSAFKQEYAWVVDALQRTNTVLSSALERLQQMTHAQQQEDENLGGAGGSFLQLYQGMLVSGLVQETIEGARGEADAACQRHVAAKYGDLLSLGMDAKTAGGWAGKAMLEKGGPAQAVIEAGAVILQVLRRCADARHTWFRACNEGREGGEDHGAAHQMTAMEVEQCVGAAVLELRRQLMLGGEEAGAEGREHGDADGGDVEEEAGLLEEKRWLLDEIESAVSRFKQDLLMC